MCCSLSPLGSIAAINVRNSNRAPAKFKTVFSKQRIAHPKERTKPQPAFCSFSLLLQKNHKETATEKKEIRFVSVQNWIDAVRSIVYSTRIPICDEAADPSPEVLVELRRCDLFLVSGDFYFFFIHVHLSRIEHSPGHSKMTRKRREIENEEWDHREDYKVFGCSKSQISADWRTIQNESCCFCEQAFSTKVKWTFW